VCYKLVKYIKMSCCFMFYFNHFLFKCNRCKQKLMKEKKMIRDSAFADERSCNWILAGLYEVYPQTVGEWIHDKNVH